ncbi:MAG: hypothetical protein RID53_17920 [Coleofasciculus sp. B1-GNL1-01]|uniref:hypothetical protein n=1 Tax=Coleofasciculus sp. B1-GNL1-01 TaxID=3068484 RepID=UPI0032F6B9DD
MKIDETRGNKMEPLFYEQPSLKKYGTMKEFTLGSGGSGGDGMGSDTNNYAHTDGDPEVPVVDLPSDHEGQVDPNRVAIDETKVD